MQLSMITIKIFWPVLIKGIIVMLYLTIITVNVLSRFCQIYYIEGVEIFAFRFPWGIYAALDWNVA